MECIEEQEECEPLDTIAWLNFVGMSKLKQSEEQVGDMTITKFFRLYNSYKNEYDREENMKSLGHTYKTIEENNQSDDYMPF